MKNVMRMLLIMATVVSLAACQKKDDNPIRVIRAMLEAPNDSLYESYPIEIGIDVEVEEEVMDEIYEKEKSIKRNWQEIVGDCFADPMFETFYNDWMRSYFLSYADLTGSSIKITDIYADKLKEGIQHYHAVIEMNNEESASETYELEWQVIYNSKNPKLIEKIEILELDGFGDSVK